MSGRIAYFASPFGFGSAVSPHVGGSVDPTAIPPGLPDKIVGTPVQLTPIPWGKRDPKLARVVLQHIADFTPPTVIPYNPFTEQRTRRVLRSMHIVHD